jgi:hypothetical protein
MMFPAWGGWLLVGGVYLITAVRGLVLTSNKGDKLLERAGRRLQPKKNMGNSYVSSQDATLLNDLR